MAAVAAEEGGGEAAPIEVHHTHAAGGVILLQKLESGRAEALVQGFAADVDQANFGQAGGSAGALRQAEQAVAAALRLVPAFQRGCGAAEHNRAACLPCSPHGQIAGVVAQFAVLFERGIVFFIHHNQPQIRQRRKHCQPGAHHQPHLAAHGFQVALGALAGGGLAVQHGSRHIGKTLLQAGDKLRREADFRQQEQHLFARCKRGGHGFEIGFGFAAASDAMQQEGGKTLRLRHRIGCGLLLGVERYGRGRNRHVGGQSASFGCQPALRLPACQLGGGLRRDGAGGALAHRALQQRLPQRGLAAVVRWWCGLLPPQIGERKIGFRLRRRAGLSFAQAGWQGGEGGLADGVVIITGSKFNQFAPGGGQRRFVFKHLRERADFGRADFRLFARAPHDAGHGFTAKRHSHAGAGRGNTVGTVGKQRVERNIEGNLAVGHGGWE